MSKRQYIPFWLLLAIIATTGCKTQQDDSFEIKTYEPHTEHQYYIEPESDTLVLHLFKITMPQDDIMNSQDGMVFIEMELDTTGHVTNVSLKKAGNFILSEETNEAIVLKIREKVRFKVTEEAKNYYLTIGDPIKINLVVLGKSLRNE